MSAENEVNTGRTVRVTTAAPEMCVHNVALGPGTFCAACPRPAAADPVSVPVDDDEYQKWLATRPECVQKMAAEFPAGSQFRFNDGSLWLFGYGEPNFLVLVTTSPFEDYEAARTGPRLLVDVAVMRELVARG